MEKMKGMEGFFTACVTPYDAQGEVNPQALTQLMSRNLDEGAAGFLVGGSSGEAPQTGQRMLCLAQMLSRAFARDLRRYGGEE